MIERDDEKVIILALRYGALQDSTPIPEDLGERHRLAQELLDFCVDAYTNDDITAGDEEIEVAIAGIQIEEMLAAGGIDKEDLK